VIDFFLGTFSSSYYLGLMLNTACILSVSALGVSFALRCGEYNLGGEGQIYFAGFVSAMLLKAFSSMPAWIALPLVLLITGLLTSAIAMVSVILKIKKNANVLLTSFLVSSAIIPVLDSLITGRFRATDGNLLATDFILEKFRLPKILEPSPLNISIFLIPVICVILYWVLYKTPFGRRLTLFGKAPEFALYSGCSYNFYLSASVGFSGFMNGVAGFLCVVGTYYTCHSGFYMGLGWNALTCSMIAFSNPLLILPCSLFLSWLYTSVDRVALINNFGFDANGIIQAVIMFAVSCVLFRVISKKHLVKKIKKISFVNKGGNK